jgi:hypothetical protein
LTLKVRIRTADTNYTMTKSAFKQTVQILAFAAFVFVATIAICTGIQNGTFSGPSLAEQIQSQGFGKMVEDRRSGEATSPR